MKSLHSAVQDYLSVRRVLGYKLEREGMWLPSFASFVEEHGSPFITTELALKWATQSEKASPQSWAKRLTMVRCFAQYIRATNPRTEIPPAELIPVRKQRLTPYLYSDADIQALMRACARLPGTLKPCTYGTLFGLLAVSGIRIGEAINLDRSDVDEHEKLLVIRNSKFGKSREVPLHITTIEALRRYTKRRDRVLRRATSSSFFVSQAGTRLLSQNAWHVFARLRRWAGLEHKQMPRIHDLRHTFAVKTLLGWYRQGANVEAQLTLLSTYLGHISPSTTYWYLTASPELLKLAANRLETSLGDLS